MLDPRPGKPRWLQDLLFLITVISVSVTELLIALLVGLLVRVLIKVFIGLLVGFSWGSS